MRKHLTAVLLFAALTIVLTNPLALHLWNGIEDKQDALLNTWITAWVGHTLVSEPLELFNANIFYPYPDTLALSEILMPPSLAALPITLATNNPILGYNVALLMMLWLNAFGMYLLVYDLTRRAEAGWVAGIIFAFNPFNLGNLAQLQLVTMGWLPLAVLSLHSFLGECVALAPRARTRWGILFVVFIVLQALASFYYALLAGFAVGLFAVWWLWAHRSAGRELFTRAVPALVVVGVVSALIVLPFMLPYLRLQRELGLERRIEESEPFSAALKQFTEVSPNNVVYGSVLAPNPVIRAGGYALDTLFPGLLAAGLAIVGILLSKNRARWYFLILLVLAFVFALGPRLYLTNRVPTDITLPYRWLYDVLPLLRALRAPVRFDMLVNFALASLAGLGLAAALMRVQVNRNWTDLRVQWLSLGVIGLIALEYLAIPAAQTNTVPVADEIPSIARWLAQQPPGVALSLPMMGPNAQGELDISAQYFTTYHWHPTPDGYSGFVLPRRGEIAYEMQAFPSERAWALLNALDVRYLSFPASTYTLEPDRVKIDVGEGWSVVPLEARSRTADFTEQLYLPSSVAAGAPFTAYLILENHAAEPYAVKPTARAQLAAKWTDGSTQELEFPIPLVTSSVSVVPITLTAPRVQGRAEVQLTGLDEVLGATDVVGGVTVGTEWTREVVLPASVTLADGLPSAVARGETLRVVPQWLAHNKIDAYYSASVRLVDSEGNKVSNVDRQPSLPTLVWRPKEAVRDDVYQLPIPSDLTPGVYSVQVLMYQADTGQDALLLGNDFEPQAFVELGTVEIK